MKIANTGKKFKPGFPYVEENDVHLIQETIPRHVKVTAQNGIITLNGIVFSEEEKMSIGDKAAAVTGFGKVHNRIRVVERK